MATRTDAFADYRCLMILLCCVTFYAVPLMAGNNDEQDLARSAFASGEIVSFSTLQARLMAQCRCQIVEAKLHSEKKHDDRLLIYDIKAITPNGQLIKLEMDARSGDIVSIKNKGWKN